MAGADQAVVGRIGELVKRANRIDHTQVIRFLHWFG
jgi:hypothetical protein